MIARKTGFSLVEAAVIVMILGFLAFIAVPRLNFAIINNHNAYVTAKQIVTALRRTRTLAISMAANNTTGFTLSRSGQTCQIIDDSNSVTVETQTMDSQISFGGGTDFHFGPLGSLRTESDTGLTVSSESRTYTIEVVAGTGIVKLTEN